MDVHNELPWCILFAYSLILTIQPRNLANDEPELRRKTFSSNVLKTRSKGKIYGV